MQIVIGGITRLTGSGLSITEWDIVFGTFPPFGENEWLEEFSKYKDTPQYQKINQGMNLSEFRFIYFWEYFHRLWARMMGICFLIPFVVFRIRGMIDVSIIKKMCLVIFFAVVAAVFGWIMVASGLIERPWVNAYKLSIHLSIGIAVFLSLLWVVLECFYKDKWANLNIGTSGWRKALFAFFALLCLQVLLGGVVSGMRAALSYPTWPDMNGKIIPDVLLNRSNWNVLNLTNYEASVFAPALFQFIHRITAYAITVLSLIFLVKFIRIEKHRPFRYVVFVFFILLFLQVFLGIMTLINSIGTIPIGYGVFHQDVGVLLLGCFFILLYAYRKATSKNYDASI